MNLALVPIPTASLDGTAPVWMPFLDQIAQRSRNDISQLLSQVQSGEIQIHIVWEPETHHAHALVGTQIEQRGSDRIGSLIWTVGEGRKRWLTLLSDLETYFREFEGCAGMKAICRPGWSKELKPHGYRVTHLMMEKDF